MNATLTFAKFSVISGAKKRRLRQHTGFFGCIHKEWTFKRYEQIEVENITSMLVDKTPISSIREIDNHRKRFFYFTYLGYRCTVDGNSCSSVRYYE